MSGPAEAPAEQGAAPNRTSDASADGGLALPLGARLTPQRRALLGALGGLRGTFTVVELFDAARRRSPSLGLATAYRTVELLRRAGALRPLPGGGRPSYIRCHPGHHHHLVCLHCGGIEDTDLCAAPADEELRTLHGFAPEGHDVDIYGTCERCLAA